MPGTTLNKENVKTIREQLGDSQIVFGSRFGVAQSAVHRWETVGIPPRGTARRLLEKFLEAFDAGVADSEFPRRADTAATA
jgi:DNA-binding transcriptional regulator YiaG